MSKVTNLAIIGLGYVGLPLAVEFGKKREVIGYDINSGRIKELQSSIDNTLEVSELDLQTSKNLSFTSNLEDLLAINTFIISVPTPIDENKCPDLGPLKSASSAIGSILKKGDIVIYESTVYPGATEEVCVPILEEESNLKFNEDFFVGYSPERINPGDKKHRLPDIVKIVSASNEETANEINTLYSEIISAGTYLASSIKVAEAAKVIENTQRDVNIGLVNELAMIFSKLGIDTEEVLKAAETKWNFLPFYPGLVGGHCIGVDPYYLTHKAQSLGYEPEIILAGRRINDSMSSFVIERLFEEFANKNILVKNSRVLIMGLSFKENCPDTRNTKVIDLVKKLTDNGVKVDVYDPWVDEKEVSKQYNMSLINYPKDNHYEAVIVAVAHKQFIDMGGNQISKFGKSESLIFDLKHVLERKYSDLRL